MKISNRKIVIIILHNYVEIYFRIILPMDTARQVTHILSLLQRYIDRHRSGLRANAHWTSAYAHRRERGYDTTPLSQTKAQPGFQKSQGRQAIISCFNAYRGAASGQSRCIALGDSK